jgi:hypothetical protein
MIRRPSSFARLHDWHRRAVAGEAVATHDGLPHAGWYKRKLVKGGPWVPVRIYVERETCPETGDLTAPERLAMEVEGIRSDRDPADDFTWLTPISRSEYDWLMDARLRDTRFADSRAPIDLSDKPTPPPGV